MGFARKTNIVSFYVEKATTQVFCKNVAKFFPHLRLQEGETYADELGRMTEAVNRRIPQLRYAPAERQGVHRMARDVAAGRGTSDSQVYGGLM